MNKPRQQQQPRPLGAAGNAILSQPQKKEPLKEGGQLFSASAGGAESSRPSTTKASDGGGSTSVGSTSAVLSPRSGGESTSSRLNSARDASAASSPSKARGSALGSEIGSATGSVAATASGSARPTSRGGGRSSISQSGRSGLAQGGREGGQARATSDAASQMLSQKGQNATAAAEAVLGTKGSSATAAAEAVLGTKGAAVATSAAAAPDLDPVTIQKVHSAVRWDKTTDELSAIVSGLNITMEQAVSATDPKTGNFGLHIAAQNGHGKLVKFLLSEKANINAQNLKGQTALHMSVEYDFYFVSLSLLDAGADSALANGDGHEAIAGIDGGKVGQDAWDNPITILKAAGDNPTEIEVAMKALQAADPASIDKGSLAQAGMAKRRACKQHWNPQEFMDLMKKF